MPQGADSYGKRFGLCHEGRTRYKRQTCCVYLCKGDCFHTWHSTTNLLEAHKKAHADALQVKQEAKQQRLENMEDNESEYKQNSSSDDCSVDNTIGTFISTIAVIIIYKYDLRIINHHGDEYASTRK
jgi:hypothetical protein